MAKLTNKCKISTSIKQRLYTWEKEIKFEKRKASRIHELINAWMDEKMDGLMDACMNAWMGKWIVQSI